MTETVDRAMGTVTAPISLKIVITGGEGVGKSTTVAQLSNAAPVQASFGAGDLLVDVDCGRTRIGDDVVLFTFGATSGPDLEAVIGDISSGALGGLVIVDSSRLADARTAVSFFTEQNLPHVVAVNYFDGATAPALKQIGEDLGVSVGVPMVRMDPRNHAQVKAAVMVLLSVIMSDSRETPEA